MSVHDLFSLAGRTVVVTGAGSGIGKAIAEACAEAGGNVVLAGRSERVEEAAAELAARGLGALGIRCDVTDEAQVVELIDGAAARFGSIDVLFANAGLADYYLRLHEMTREQWDDVIATNLTSVFLCAKHALRHMVAQGRGKVIPTASIWGEIGSDGAPVPGYAAAKGGVVNLTRELALEYAADGITVNALSPGFFATRIGQDKVPPPGAIELLVEKALAVVPTHRVMDPAEIKGTALYLASAASDAMNGHVLTVDLGVLAR